MIRALALGLALAALPADSLYQLEVPLTDQAGRAARLDLHRGHPVMVTMFYGSCPQACPLLITKMKLAEARLSPEERADLRVLLVSLDPEHDTPEAMTLLARGHAVDPARWTFARTDEGHVRELAAALGIKYHRLNTGGFWHSSVITVLDREGRPAGKAEGLELDVAGLVADLHRQAR